ncbi:hypothetical protein [uncultured Bacteroides sp.]|uniref:hypothetical protein n=1 Tax=uncultured Bacteroides sp. TaxID=162156 RepID=UPI002AA8A88C|nr:hypothetical protein [uncultured Bacteroides sp.]
MLTSNTKKVVALLYDIYHQREPSDTALCVFSDSSTQMLLSRLEKAKLICLRTGEDANLVSSYELCCPLFDITLRDLLVATGEGLCPVFDNKEGIYDEYGAAACRLGVLNEVMCEMLEKIRITDL